MTASAKPDGLTRRRAETRKRLIDAAYEVFAEYGIRDAPVEVICDRAGYTRGAFYSNFESKEQLYLAVFEAQAEERIRRLREAVDAAVEAADMTGPDAMQRVLHDTTAVFLHNLSDDVTWYLLSAEFRALALRQPELHAPTVEAENRFYAELAEILTDALRRIGMRLTADPRMVVITVTAVYQAMLDEALLGDLPPSGPNPYVDEMLPRLLELLVEPAD
ncbi:MULTISPECIES: TetR/AcrR family transcriptional regulator [Thermocrispum]|uniref:TetR/AcrR family transcriptional regulator n=1 Tax=Thermocrispum agreste TaxID=37925 RepID=A0A2W4LF37_9PSEU|nr:MULTISPECIES: TetR/AcrR family transcriptional regulator [Thermocrispum]PZM94266.1 MAG: TetR/AcrR family transcriptional regulator [Thermocrispum agreste]